MPLGILDLFLRVFCRQNLQRKNEPRKFFYRDICSNLYDTYFENL